MSIAFENSDPELFAAYKLAARKENHGTRKLAMKGVIQNKETGEALKGVHIIIPELKIDHKCRGKKGGYQIKNIETGIFPITYHFYQTAPPNYSYKSAKQTLFIPISVLMKRIFICNWLIKASTLSQQPI